MKIITHNEIVNHGFSPLDCYKWATDIIARKKDAVLPPKISLKPQGDIFFNTMPSLLPDIDRFGVKVVSRFPRRVPSLDSQILLYDLKTGECLAVIDGNWITAMRTGAVAAHSIKLLAKNGFSVLGYIGLGNMAAASLLVLASIYPQNMFIVKLKKYKNQHEIFAQRFKDYNNLKFEYYDEYTEVIEGSDVVVSAATYFEDDICDFSSFSDGVLVVPIHTRGFTQCDYLFDKIYADDIGHVCHFKNYDKYRFIHEVCDVVDGTVDGRLNDKEKIMVYNIGISLHDIYFATKIFEALNTTKCDVGLTPPSSKFWV